MCRSPFLGLVMSGILLLLGGGCRTHGPTFDPYGTGGRFVTNRLETTVVTNQLDASLLEPPQTPFRLGPGDRLEIELLGEGDGPANTFVGPDGKVYYHLLPGLQVWGLTLPETKRLLEERLAEYVNNPQISVSVRGVESRRIWVMGRVNAPGIFPLEAPMTVIEAIARAGGLFTSRLSGTTEELADLHHSFLVRRGKHVPVNFYRLIREGDTTQNIFLQPDDFLYLPSALASEVFVIGAVRHPQRVGFNDQVTVISAIAQAGGPAEDAWLGHVAVIRGSLSSPAIAVVDYKAIVRGKQADVLLEPRDIVYVPLSPYRSLRRYADVALETFVRTVAANEGARVVDPNYIPPGVSVPLGQ